MESTIFLYMSDNSDTWSCFVLCLFSIVSIGFYSQSFASSCVKLKFIPIYLLFLFINNLHTVQCVHFMNSLKCFNKSIHLYNPYFYQNIKTILLLQKFPLCLIQSICNPPTPKPLNLFYHHKLVVSVLQYFINRITKYILICGWHISA